ncbi:MAG TPA: thiamine phosphate synthase [Luteimonas sp.]
MGAPAIPVRTDGIRRGLYLLTPDEPDTARLLARVAPVLGFASLLQYRNKLADPSLAAAQVRALLPLCSAHGVPLLVNDDWPLALGAGADGAHLGEDDGDLAAARAALGPDAIIGASCYDSLATARSAAAAGASYVAFGACFPSPTKPGARRVAAGLLREARQLGLPVVAIGGITPDNGPGVVQAGADLLAVISGVFDAPDPAGAARAYLRAFAGDG